nr:hypothetical protein [uncultured Lichenicoccus sp.]
MHRLIPYPAAVPLDTDLLNAERWAVQGLGQLAGATHGFGVTAASGLVVTPGSSGLTVTVAPGAVLQTAATDPNAYGSLAADADLTVQQWLLDTATTVTVPATNTTYYVYVTQVTGDDTPVVLPFYNASNPSQTYAGQGNAGATLPTRRAKTLAVGIATSVPTSSVQIATVLVPSGNTTVAATNIAYLSGTATPPFYPTLPQLVPTTFTPLLTTQAVIAPAWAGHVEVQLIGGGGGGGDCAATGSSNGSTQVSGGGGGAGGFGWGKYAVTPGASYTATIGAGGSAQVAGGTTSFGPTSGSVFLSATGGGFASFTSTATSAGAAGGNAVGGTIINQMGGQGSDGQAGGNIFAGNGGVGFFGGNGRAGSHAGLAATGYGSGGGGAYDAAFTGNTYQGGSGAPGIVLYRWLA